MNISQSSKDRANDKENEFNTFGKDNFRNANTGEEVRMVTENWDSPLANGIAFKSEVDKEDNWYKYLRHLPDQMVIDFLTIEQFGEDPDLIAKYFNKPYIVEPIQLASFPEETLKFLVKRYN